MESCTVVCRQYADDTVSLGERRPRLIAQGSSEGINDHVPMTKTYCYVGGHWP